MTRALVTGGAGFIGRHLVSHLLQHGDRVCCLVRPESLACDLQALGAEVVRGDLAEPRSLLEGLEGVSVVYHLAGRVSDWGPMDGFLRDNVQGTENLLEASVKSGVERFVHMSSLSVHGFGGFSGGNEQSPFVPVRWPYCVTKRMAEDLVRRYAEREGLRYTITRSGTVYGPGDWRTFYPIAQGLQRWFAGHVNRGLAMMSPAYVENLVSGIRLAGESAVAMNQVYNLVDDPCSWADFFSKIATALGVRIPTLSLPGKVVMMMARGLEGVYRLLRRKEAPLLTTYRIALVSRDFSFLNDRARRELGFIPSVSFDEGIRRSVEWFRTVDPSRAATNS